MTIDKVSMTPSSTIRDDEVARFNRLAAFWWNRSGPMRPLYVVNELRLGYVNRLSLAVLSTALLFGGTTLYSFGFAAFLFTDLPTKTAEEALRRAFPWFYAIVIATSAAAALLWWSRDAVLAGVMAACGGRHPRARAGSC